MSGPLLVLMYHGLHRAATDRGRFDPRYSVRPDAFERQMQRLRERWGRSWVPSADAGRSFPRWPSTRSAVMVSFDDGDISNAEVALPCLQRLGLRAVFFVTSGFVDTPGMLGRGQLRELVDAGMTVGSHGATHRFLSSLDDAELEEELRGSREVLEQACGAPVDLLALPGGRGGARELEAAKRVGYRLAFNSEPGANRRPAPQRYVQRVAITRDTSDADFEQILDWSGPAVRRLCWRHRLLRVPKQLLGDERYDRLRQVLVG